MRKENIEKETLNCPAGKFLEYMEMVFDNKSEFVGHLVQSRIEFLKAIRSLIDGKIERLEKKRPATGKRKMTKIKVE